MPASRILCGRDGEMKWLRAIALLAACYQLSGCAAKRPDCTVIGATATSKQGSASCAAVHEGRLLVIRHLYSGKLDLPGGRGKAGETAQCTAHRETWEETGIDVNVHEAVAVAGNVFRCVPVSHQSAGEDPTLHWWSRTEVTAVYWMELDAISPEQWRYGDRIRDLQRALGADIVAAD